MAVLNTGRPYNSGIDANNYPTLTALSGTAGTADTAGTSEIFALGGNPTTGAQYVEVIAGTLVTNETETTGFNGGTVAVGTAAVELTFTGVTQSIMITADFANGTIIYLGGSDVTQAGVNALTFLQPDQSATFDLNDTSAPLYAIGGTTGQKVYKIALT